VASPKAPVLDAKGKRAKDVTLEAAIFGADVKPQLVHETVRAEFAEDRRGTRKVKTRGLVAGGRSKPWRQKGTGRARSGSTRGVQWTGGSAAFDVRTNFKVKVNRKERRAAMRSALSDHAQAGTLALLSGDGWDEPSTRAAADLLADRERPAVVVALPDEDAILKSFRNLDRVVVVAPGDLEVAQVVWAQSLLVTEDALPVLEERAQ
jgi:large subunit ribosomal protein L4